MSTDLLKLEEAQKQVRQYQETLDTVRRSL
jgi:hypothetical protein